MRGWCENKIVECENKVVVKELYANFGSSITDTASCFHKSDIQISNCIHTCLSGVVKSYMSESFSDRRKI
jgi:hypothetical protein